MKKYLALFLAFAILFAFTGCADSGEYSPTLPSESTPSASLPTGPYPDFDPTPVRFTEDEIWETAIHYIKDKQPDSSQHIVGIIDLVNENWLEDTFILKSAEDLALFDALGYGAEYMQLTIVRYTYEYQDKIAYTITLSYKVPTANNTQLLAYIEDDLHRLAGFRQIPQSQVSYSITKKGTAGSTNIARLDDSHYEQLLSSNKVTINTKDTSQKGRFVRFSVKADSSKYCIDVTINA